MYLESISNTHKTSRNSSYYHYVFALQIGTRGGTAVGTPLSGPVQWQVAQVAPSYSLCVLFCYVLPQKFFSPPCLLYEIMDAPPPIVCVHSFVDTVGVPIN